MTKRSLHFLAKSSSDFRFLGHVFSVAVCLLGLSLSTFFFSFLLFVDIVGLPGVARILKSVAPNFRQITLILMLILVIVYVFSSLNFLFLRDQFDIGPSSATGKDMQACASFLGCMFLHWNQGVRSDTGVADVMKTNNPVPWLWHSQSNGNFPPMDRTYSADFSPWRVLIDVAYFIVVVILMLGIMQGVIVDSFTALRDRTLALEVSEWRRRGMRGCYALFFQHCC